MPSIMSHPGRKTLIKEAFMSIYIKRRGMAVFTLARIA
jgi:hypothetical protein